MTVLAELDHVGVVAGGRRVSLNRLLADVLAITGAKLVARHEAARSGDVRDSLADLGRARDLLEYAPRVELREGLRRTIESFRRLEGEVEAA